MGSVQSVEDYLANGGEITQLKYGRHSIAFARYSACKARAKKQGWAFDLTISWIGERIDKGFCEATGIRFSKSYGSPWIPSVDRIDSKKGYTQDNCWVVCWAFNNMKSDFGIIKLLELCEIVVKNKENILNRM